MQINADFSKRSLVRFKDTPWVASPAAGVERKMLDRLGDEVARATTIVRFAPGSAFSAHTHDGGEEYFVLEGVFQDELGDFPAGTYVRNPPTSRHTPATEPGATIFVKLHQFDPTDREEVRADMSRDQLLFENAEERVEVLTLAPDDSLDLNASGGAEVFVLSGSITEAQDTLTAWDWLRLPPGRNSTLQAGPDGARLWTKTGHLAARPPKAPYL